jgi:DNA-directed RNA polymerase specialized sigma24 family protein
MDSSSSAEVRQWLLDLGEGDELAAQRIWEKYFAKLLLFARHKMADMRRRAFDEEDVAVSAMHSFCRGMRAGRFPSLDDREDLWKLLVTITARKVCAQRRRCYADKRGGGRERGQSAWYHDQSHQREDGINEVLGHEPTPDLAARIVESCHEMLECLDEKARQVALWTLEGYDTTEIAEKLGCVRRTVERKLELIRANWTQRGLVRQQP